MNPSLPSFRSITCLVSLLLLLCTQGQSQIRYVSLNATGTADGSNWTNAFTHPQQAIDAAAAGDSIFVAEGIYFPSFPHSGDSARHSTFYISKTISLFGGFSGAPGTEGGFQDRNVGLYPTILSGDIGIPGDNSDNAFHVLYLDHVSDSTRIDGFTIEKGNGTNGAGLESTGAGIFNDASAGLSNPTIANCIIRDNTSVESGGGMTNQAENGGIASPTLINCSFTGNTASGGGGVNNYTDTDGESSPVFLNCRFMGNSGATAGGGAIQCIAHSAESSPVLINCILTGNHAPNSAPFSVFVTGTGVSASELINCAISGNTGSSMRIVDLGIQTSTVRIRNSILWANGASQAPSTNGATVDAAFSIIPFGFPGEGIIGLDPMYISQPPVLDSAHVLGDLHLLPGSPAFDAGDNTAIPSFIDTDLDLLPRFVNAVNGQAGTVDIGPYEFQGNTTGIESVTSEHKMAIYPNPTNGLLHVMMSDTRENGVIRISDLQGKTIRSTYVYKKAHDQFIVDLSGLPSGTYVITYFNGYVVETRTAVLQNP